MAKTHSGIFRRQIDSRIFGRQIQKDRCSVPPPSAATGGGFFILTGSSSPKFAGQIEICISLYCAGTFFLNL